MLESPPVSPKTVRHGKRSRQSSTGQVSVRDLSQEDTGYDGDVEIVRPDEVEEPESEFENEDTDFDLRRLLWPDTDEELASKMKRLGWKSKDKDARNDNKLEKPGAKRLSKEADPSYLNQYGKRTDFEISEMADASHKTPDSKRRRDSRLTKTKRVIESEHEMQTDTSERTDGGGDKTFSPGRRSVSSAQKSVAEQEMDLD